jgi:hypothetical protein
MVFALCDFCAPKKPEHSAILLPLYCVDGRGIEVAKIKL